MKYVQCPGRNLRRRGHRRGDDRSGSSAEILPSRATPTAQGQAAAARERLNRRPAIRDAPTHSRRSAPKAPFHPPDPSPAQPRPNPLRDRTGLPPPPPRPPHNAPPSTRSASPYGVSSASGSSPTRGSVFNRQREGCFYRSRRVLRSSSAPCFVRFGAARGGRLMGPGRARIAGAGVRGQTQGQGAQSTGRLGGRPAGGLAGTSRVLGRAGSICPLIARIPPGSGPRGSRSGSQPRGFLRRCRLSTGWPRRIRAASLGSPRSSFFRKLRDCTRRGVLGARRCAGSCPGVVQHHRHPPAFDRRRR